MNRIKAGVLLAVAWAVTVLLSSCGEKETGPVLSAYDYGHQAGEAVSYTHLRAHETD